jgi:hypothetical protein
MWSSTFRITINLFSSPSKQRMRSSLTWSSLNLQIDLNKTSRLRNQPTSVQQPKLCPETTPTSPSCPPCILMLKQVLKSWLRKPFSQHSRTLQEHQIPFCRKVSTKVPTTSRKMETPSRQMHRKISRDHNSSRLTRELASIHVVVMLAQSTKRDKA